MTIRIDLWTWRLDQPAGTVATLARLLDAEETHRAAAFLRPGDGDRFTVGRGRLREILGHYVSTPPQTLRFGETGRKKPILPGGPAFNLSHSDGIAALAVAPDHSDLPLGIDIEAHRPIEPGLPGHVFSAAECQELSGLSGDAWRAGFFNAWTRKEAVIKAMGQGLLADLKGFDVTLAPGAPPRLTRSSPPLPPVADWTLAALDIGPGFAGALAAVTGGAPVAIRLRDGRLPL